MEFKIHQKVYFTALEPVYCKHCKRIATGNDVIRSGHIAIITPIKSLGVIVDTVYDGRGFPLGGLSESHLLTSPDEITLPEPEYPDYCRDCGSLMEEIRVLKLRLKNTVGIVELLNKDNNVLRIRALDCHADLMSLRGLMGVR